MATVAMSSQQDCGREQGHIELEVWDSAPAAGFSPTPEYEGTDYETLSPLPLSPYGGGASTPSGLTPQTESLSPISPYIPVALGELVQARQLENTKSSQEQEKNVKDTFCCFETASILAHLATFGFLGVLVRYGIGELFDGVGGVTSANSSMFHDLPANMLGCFFMGWVGAELKKDILHFSEHLALGLSTGLMGSITTFSSWMVKLVELMVRGYWLRGLIGIVVGAELAFASFYLGMRSAPLARWCYSRCKPVAADNKSRKLKSLVVFSVTSLLLLSLFIVLAVLDKRVLNRQRLWLACAVSPLGVWTRWLLAKQNGKGVCSLCRWLPWGTLSANLLACFIGFLVLTAQLIVDNHESSLWCGAVQLGFLGCLSTVSTLVLEAYNLERGSKLWRAYVYVFTSIVAAILLGIAFFASVVWAKGLTNSL